MRKLATIREIGRVQSIEKADRLELVHVDGWQCVVGKGEFKTGDKCVYFEIDSFLPVYQRFFYSDDVTLEHGNTIPFMFLEPRAIEYNGVYGARIKTMKLRGVISQGLAMPLSNFPFLDDDISIADRDWET